MPSGTVLARHRPTPERKDAPVLAVGDPVYDGTLASLTASGEEARAVGDKVLLRQDASETRVLAALRAGPWRAVHIACHGLVDTERPAFSSLALTVDPANDGRLMALDLFRLELDTDLVVLSACDSGRGRVVRGEGIFGLGRAFLSAGAPQVVASLWKVDDAATKALMVHFYELWNPSDGAGGIAAADALRGAQEHVRTHAEHPEWKHPFYWAAWVLWAVAKDRDR